jgi:hypothetical protein
MGTMLLAMAQPTQQQGHIDATISSARASRNQWMDDSLNRASHIQS